MTVRINKQKINLREKLAETEEKVNFDEVVRGLGENTAPLILNKDGGNVGIGTTNPDVDLHIGTNTGNAKSIRLESTGTKEHKLQFASDGVTYGQVGGGKSDSGEGDLRFYSYSAGLSEVMRIDSDGNVGIGATSPNQKITIGFADDGADGISFRSSSYLNLAKILAENESSSTNGNLQFHTRLAGDINEAMRITSTGNVGIGTTNPDSYKLNVNGTTFCTSGTWSGSDDRIKHNEQPIIGALETISKITPKKYIKTTEMYDADHDFELDADGNPVDSNGEPVEHRIEAGVIAQQVLTIDELAFAVSPEGVDEDGTVTSPHGLDYNSLFTYAIAAIQEQQTIINDLKSRIETLEQQ